VLNVRKLAALAGVSRTTVSLALRNSPRISLKTRERVQQIARKNGYRSDPSVARLMTELRTLRMKRSVEKLAYLTNWKTAWGWKEAYNERNYYEGACQRAVELGYEIEHVWASEPGMSQSRLSKILYTRGIRGVIISPLLRARGHLSLHWKHFAVSAVSLTVYKPDIHRATHSHQSGMTTALRSLKHRGYRRIGLANLKDMDERVNRGWLAAYLHNNYYIPASQQIPPLMVSSWTTPPFKEWVRRYSPDVVLSNTTYPYWLLKKLGYRVPKDIGFANLDISDEKPSCSGIDQRPQEVGAVVVDLVTRQLQNNELNLPLRAQTVMIDGIWKDGETTLRLKSTVSTLASQRKPKKKPVASPGK